MNRRTRSLALAALTCAAALAGPSAGQAAEAIYAVTDQAHLVSVNSSNPTALLTDRSIAGLAAGERIIGLDIRPANDELYALASTGRVLTVNRTTGRAAALTSAPFALAGTRFGFDFNPTSDRIRVVSDADQNLRINPDNGNVIAADGPIAYAAGDANAGRAPDAVASAYSNNVRFANATELFALDVAQDVLALQNPPNSGTLTTRGPLGVDATDAQFDIASDGVAYAALSTAGQPAGALYRVNLSTGAAAPVPGPHATIGTRPITALAAAGQIEDDKSAPNELVAVSSTQLRGRLLSRDLRVAVSCDERCFVSGTLTAGGRTIGTGTGEVGDRSKATVVIALNAAGRAAVRRPGFLGMRLVAVVQDGAGNSRTVTRSIRER
jgi:hypothetical protein